MLTLRQLSLVLMLLMMGTSPSLLLQVEGTSPSSSTSTDNPSSDPLTTSSTSDRASSDGTTTSRSSSSKLSLRHIFRIGAKDDSPFSSSPSSQIYFERTDFHPDPLHPSNLETSWIPDSDLLHTLPTSVREEAAGVRHPRESVKRLKIIQDIATLLPPPTFFSGAPLLPSSHNKRIKKTQPDYADLKIEHVKGRIPMWSGFSDRAFKVKAAMDDRHLLSSMSVDERESLEWWNEIFSQRRNNTTNPNDERVGETQEPLFSVLDANGEPVTVAHKSHLLPDDRSKDTVLAMGKMAYNAYYEPTNREWVEVPGWGASDGFGTKGSGIRGYIYASENQDVVVIVIKGTSLQTPFTGGPSSANDKLNDNKMFSCCCGKAGWSWTPVCGCANRAATSCDTDCVRSESDFKESYYRLATSIGHTVQQLFPSSSIWMTGHSLGGALASLVALTFDYPAMTFEAPGDLLFSKRLGLLPPFPPTPAKTTHRSGQQQPLQDDTPENDKVGKDGDLTPYVPFLKTLSIYQFGNDGDPVYLGDCRSVTSSCWYGGYALETHCHIGKECLYQQDTDGKTPPPPITTPPTTSPTRPTPHIPNEDDGPFIRNVTITKSSSISYHGIQYVIDRYLTPWEYVPECGVNLSNGKEGGCSDCEAWNWT